MEQSSSERKQTVRHQFDSFCKMVLHGEKVNYEKEMEYRGRHEISLSQVPEEELSRLYTVDEYIAESEMFRVLDYDIEVKDELISEALKYLPEKKRNVILLSFFMDMSDTEIAKHMNLVRSTIQIASENLKKLSGNSQVGIEIVLEYEDDSTESRFIDLY